MKESPVPTCFNRFFEVGGQLISRWITMSWRRLAEVLVVGGALTFVGWKAYQGWDEVSRLAPRLRAGPLLASGVLALVFWLLNAWNWRILMSRLGQNLKLERSLRIYFLGNLARYLPGKVWYMAGRAYVGEKDDLSALMIITGSVVELSLSFLSSTLVAVLGLPLLLDRLGSDTVGLAVGAAFLVLVGLQPEVLRWGLGLASRLLGRPEIEMNLTRRDLFELLFLFLIPWFLASAALFLLLNALHSLPLTWFPTVIAAYAAAFLLGLLAPFAPAGLGVREGALVLLLGRSLPVGVVAGVAVWLRLWLLLAEAVWAVLVLRPDKRLRLQG